MMYLTVTIHVSKKNLFVKRSVKEFLFMNQLG